MGEEYDEPLRANLRKLSSLGATIEEVRDRPFKRLQALEMGLLRLSEQVRTAAGREEVVRLRESVEDLNKRLDSVERALRDGGAMARVERELRSSFAALEERVKGLDRSLRDAVKRLSQIDSEIIDEMAKLQELVGGPEEGAPVPEPPPRKVPEARPPPAKSRAAPPSPPPGAEARGRREELKEERERLLAQLGRATEEHGAGHLSTEEYEELLRKGEERLAQIDEELERAGA